MCFSLRGTDVKKDVEFTSTFMVDGEGGKRVIKKTAWSAYEFKPFLQSSDTSGCGTKQMKFSVLLSPKLAFFFSFFF